MTKKRKRTKSSYYGNTPEMISHQRMNITPGNSWDKRHRKELKFDCWWRVMPLGNMQEVYEDCVNHRIITFHFEDEPVDLIEKYDIQDASKLKLKDEEYLDNWWENDVELEDKKFYYKNQMDAFSKETRSEIFKDMYECLEEKIKEEEEAREEREARKQGFRV